MFRGCGRSHIASTMLVVAASLRPPYEPREETAEMELLSETLAEQLLMRESELHAMQRRALRATSSSLLAHDADDGAGEDRCAADSANCSSQWSQHRSLDSRRFSSPVSALTLEAPCSSVSCLGPHLCVLAAVC